MYLCLQYVCAGANLRDTGVFWHYTCVNFDTVLKLFFYSSAYDWVSSICVPLSNGNKLYNLTIVCSAFMTKAVRCSGSRAVCFVRNVGKSAACCGFLFTFFPGALKKKPTPDKWTCLYLLCWGSYSMCCVWKRGACSSSRCDALSPQLQDTCVGPVPPNLSAALRWGQGNMELPELFSSGKRRVRGPGEAGCVLLRVGGLLCPRTS